MQNKWKTTKLYKKLKDIRVDRAVILSVVVILLSLTMVLAVTVATNRAKKQTGTQVEITEAPPTNTPATEDRPTGTEPQPTETAIPEMSLPTGGKLAKKHSVDVQVFSQTMQDFRAHLGIDIATAAGAEVFAPANGTVKKIWEDPMMGWSVAIAHSGECVTIYKNLAPQLAEGLAEGSEVKCGQLIGTVGDSAMLEIADEPHLHMEMTVKGLQVDPLEYFSAAVIATLYEDTAFEQPDSSGK